MGLVKETHNPAKTNKEFHSQDIKIVIAIKKKFNHTRLYLDETTEQKKVFIYKYIYIYIYIYL